MKASLLLCSVLIGLLSPAAYAASVADQCLTDLNALPSFILTNDAGAKEHYAEKGQAFFDTVLKTAQGSASQVKDNDACKLVLRTYLKSWRKFHFGIRTLVQQPAGEKSQVAAPEVLDEMPEFKVLSPTTVLWTIRSFDSPYEAPLTKLIQENHATLASHPNWIIDVRVNGGGNDTTYAPLLPWLLADEQVRIGAAWLVTPENILAQERACHLDAANAKACQTYTAPVVQQMKTAKTGNFIAQEGSPPISYERTRSLEPKRPARVAVLMAGHCGSTCEEFLLAVRQSFNVKLLGRNSAGGLDYSNLRPYDLPSGQRQLFYATSRSYRLPAFQVDLGGIQPDIYLPEAANADDKVKAEEVLRVQRWLEGGSLAPTSESVPKSQ